MWSFGQGNVSRYQNRHVELGVYVRWRASYRFDGDDFLKICVTGFLGSAEIGDLDGMGVLGSASYCTAIVTEFDCAVAPLRGSVAVRITGTELPGATPTGT